MIRLVLVILTVAAAAVTVQGSPFYTTKKVINYEPKSYGNAVKSCESLGMKLMVIQSKAKMLEILELMHEQRRIHEIWLDIKRDPKDPKKYIIPAIYDLPVLHTFFMPGEPKHFSAKCVRLVGNRTNKEDFMRWEMGNCEVKKPYICEYI